MVNFKKIIRVFPYRTSYTPVDDYVFIGYPQFIIPEHDEVHVSCIFTWDRPVCLDLQFQWQGRTNKPVLIGGPAFNSPCNDFTSGLYVNSAVTFTTRGCNNNCPWCMVPKVEGKLRELPVVSGRIVQDNNFLQASRLHKDKVFEMLKTQKAVCFKGGLEADLVDDHFLNSINSLYYTRGNKKISRIAELWLACDTDERLPLFKSACEKLSKLGFTRDKIKCYVLSYGKDMAKDEKRARAIYEAGAMPFMQLYRDFSEIKTEYSKEWNAFARMWQRPAAIKAHVEKGTDFKNFST